MDINDPRIVHYFGEWLDNESLTADLNEIALTRYILSKAPDEFDFTEEDIIKEAGIRFGYDPMDIARASWNLFVDLEGSDTDPL